MEESFTFGSFRLDAGAGVLARAGTPVELPAKAVQLLVALVRRAPAVVSKNDLFAALWPDVVVEEGNLSKLVFLLRKAVGEDAIETVPKCGYRFAASVAEDERCEVIVVLPFADLSEARDHASFCEGVSEEILTAVARLPEAKVVARASSFKLAGLNASEIGARVGATLLIEGSIRRDGDALRIAARLVDTRTGHLRWSQLFDRPARDIFAVQGEIARAVAKSVRPLSPEPSPLQPVDLVAYELYLQGRYYWNRRPGEVVWQALRCLEQAVEREPRFAAAWAAIGDIYATLGSWESGVLESDRAAAMAQASAARALEIDPDLADAHTTVAYTALHNRRSPKDAEAGFRRALRLNPSYAAAHHWYSHSLAAEGRFAESLEQSRAALSIDPINLLLNVHLSWHHFMARDPARALEEADRVVGMDSRFHWGHFFVSWAAEALGETRKAVEEMRQAVRCSGEDAVMVAGLSRAYAAAGDRAEALRLLGEIEKRREGRALFAYEEALVHLALGDRERALTGLESARAGHSGWLAYLNVDPRLDPLRQEKRFEALRTID